MSLSKVTENSTVGIGANVEVTGSGATAIGSNTKASNTSSVSIGFQANSSGDSAIAIGGESNSSGDQSIALGNSATATKYGSIAIGTGSIAEREAYVTGFKPTGISDKTDIDEKAFTSTAAEMSIGKDGTIRQITHVSAGSKDTDAVNVAQLKSLINLGMKFNADKGVAQNNKLGSQINIQGDHKNIHTTISQDNQGNSTIQVQLNPKLTVDTVQANQSIHVGTPQNGTVINSDGISIHNGPSLTNKGLNNGDKQITHVASGLGDRQLSEVTGDALNNAVNVGDLQKAFKQLPFDQKINQVKNDLDAKIHDMGKKANAGIAASMAMANLPQPFSAGKSMIGASISHYRNEHALSIGVSRISDNGKWIIKTSVSEDTQHNFGAGISTGYQW